MAILRLRHHSQIHDTSNQWYHLAFHMYRNTSGRSGFQGLSTCIASDLYRHIVQVRVNEAGRMVPDVLLTIGRSMHGLGNFGGKIDALWCEITASFDRGPGQER
jgi:hypothetical protein